MTLHRFSFPTAIHFGQGASSKLGDLLKSAGAKRPLFVTDRGIAPLSFFKRLTDNATEAGLSWATYSDIAGNPVKSQVSRGVEAYRAHNADSIVGVGGGAALDVAKAMLLMVNHPGDLFDYEDDLPGARPVDQVIPYWIAIPTTAGTGSEVGRSAVISDNETHRKKIIFSPRLLAPAVLADPLLTLDLPADITATTGLDALTHCVEAFLAKGFHPLCDGIALEGTRLIARSLSTAVQAPHDLEARGNMLMASMMGAIAFQKGLGVVHSCAHALSTVVDMHHGLANGIMIDHALQINIECAPDRFLRLAHIIGLHSPGPDAFFTWLNQIKREVGIPANLKKAGVSADKLDTLVEVALADVCHANNPRPVSKADFEDIFKRALA